MNRPSRCQRLRTVPASSIHTIADAYNRCPFRSLVSLIPGTREELIDRVGAAFAAVGGEVEPIRPDMLAELVNTVRRGQTVVVFGDHRALRDAAKSQLMAAVNAAMVGAVGSA